MPERAYETFNMMVAREEREERENNALCASEGHPEPYEVKMYVEICPRCRKVMRYR